jgi:MFS family permease
VTRLGSAYTRLWTASTTSNLGDGLIQVGAPLVAVQLTREPVLVAGVQMAATLPWLFLALYVGAIADRRDRRTLMVGAAVFRASIIAAVGITIAFGHLSLLLIYLAVLAFGIGEVFFDTSSQSLVPDLVERDQLGRANGRLIGAQVVMNNFVGAPLAGLLVGVGAASVFLGPAALYLVAAAILLALTGRYVPPDRPPATLRSDITEGLVYLRGQPTLKSIAGTGAFMNLSNTAYFSVFVLFVVGADSPMGLNEVAFGLLATALAAGSVLGSLLAPRIEARIGPRRTILGGLVTLSLSMLTPVVTAHPLPIAAMALVIGASGIVVNVASVSSRQRMVPAQLLGRVNAAFRLVVVGMMPLGAALGGLITSSFGLRVLFASAVGVQLAAIVLFQRHIRDEVLRADPVTGPAPGTDDPATVSADEPA